MILQIQKDSLLGFLEAVQKVNDTFIFDIKDDGSASVIAVTGDETCFLYGTTTIDSGENVTLNIPDAKKFVRAIKFIKDDEIDLTVTSNALKYKSPETRFTYHLYDENFLKRPKINIDKVKSFDFDVAIDLKRDDIRKLAKNASFVDQANKLYLFTEDDRLMGEITDKERANTDSVCVTIAENVVDTVPQIILKLDNIQLLYLCNEDVRLRINTKIGLLAFEIESGLNKFMYILTSLKK